MNKYTTALKFFFLASTEGSLSYFMSGSLWEKIMHIHFDAMGLKTINSFVVHGLQGLNRLAQETFSS